MARPKKVVLPAVILPYHYFASTVYGWSCADTRAEAVAGCARYAGRDIINANTKKHSGLYCCSYRVELPKSAPYEIRNYAPHDVLMSPMREHRIVDIKGNVRVEE